MCNGHGKQEEITVKQQFFFFSSNSNTEEGFDAILEHHQNMQEKIAEEMIQMAQNLKHNSMVASNILKKDNKVILAKNSFDCSHCTPSHQSFAFNNNTCT